MHSHHVKFEGLVDAEFLRAKAAGKRLFTRMNTDVLFELAA